MREMKDSGVEWVGKILQTYNIKRLKYVFQIMDELRQPITADKRNQNAETLYDYYGASGPIDKIDGYTIDDHVLLIGEDGANLQLRNLPLVYEVRGKAWINNHAHILKPGEELCFRYAFHMLESLDINPYITGSAQPKFNQESLRNLYVIVPPFSEQRRIADFLDAKCSEIDALTADIQSQIDTLEQYKRSVITEAVTKGLDPDAEMRDSGIPWIGKIPVHWECIRGKYILKYLQKPVREDDGVITCFRDGEVTLRSNRREDGFTVADKEIGYQGVDVGDLVVHGMDGFAGAMGISDSRGKASPVLNVLETAQNKRYIMYFLRSMAYRDVFLAMATGIRVRSCDLRWNKLSELFYPIPPLEEQEAIVAHIDDVIEKANAVIADKKAQLETLEEYKKSLIFEYVTGKKEVPVS